MRELISVAVLVALLVWRRHFVALAPLAQYAGYFLMTDALPMDRKFLIGYAEALVLLIYARQVLSEKRGLLSDRMALILVLMPWLAAPALLFAKENRSQALFIIVLLSLSGFLYRYFVTNMPGLLASSIFDRVAALWLAFGVVTKATEGLLYGATYDPTRGAFSYAVLSRSGGMGGSNLVGQILLMMLPLIQGKILIAVTVVFLLLTFSRGVYVVLATVLLFMTITGKTLGRTTVRMAIGAACAAILLLNAVPENLRADIIDLGESRLVGISGVSTQERLINRYSVDEGRSYMADEAMRIWGATDFQGIGLGGFFWGEALVGNAPEFSNAHNVYLTLLAEGGLIVAAAFVAILLFTIRRAFLFDKRAAISLVAFALYGLFSGEIYETAGIVSLAPYYPLLLVFAYVAAGRGSSASVHVSGGAGIRDSRRPTW